MCGTDCYQVNDLEHSAYGMNCLRSLGFCEPVVILTETQMLFRGRSEVVLEPKTVQVMILEYTVVIHFEMYFAPLWRAIVILSSGQMALHPPL